MMAALNDVLLIVVLKTDQPLIKRRLDMILAAAEPTQPDTEPCVWAKATHELVAADLDALAALIGWEAVERLRVGAASAGAEQVVGLLHAQPRLPEGGE